MLQLILLILELSAQALAQIESGNVVGKDAKIAQALIGIYQKASSAFQATQGQPIDEALVPPQTPVTPTS